jgi:hypothetical protein
MKFSFTPTLASLALCIAGQPAAFACSSCGCTLSSDWASQGLSASAGWHIDLRHDYFNQDELRSGIGRVNRASISLPSEQEIQQKTVNRNTTLTLDHGFNADWGVTLQLPYFDRYHTTVAEGDTDISTSRSSSIGDVRVVGRYQGFSPARDWGVQFGLKLPTGRTDVNFSGGPQAGQPLDSGLQPGTGSTDLLIGVFRFGAINESFDYFAQALLQLPLNSKAAFKPGIGANLSAGVRYLTDSRVTPQLQLNMRTERRESGASADVENSGATLAYLSPGATVALTHDAQVYGFVQLPVYQRVNGLQLEPRYSVSVGLRYNL